MELLIAFIQNFVVFYYLVATCFVLVKSFEKKSLLDPYKLAFITLISFALAVHSVVEPSLSGCSQ